MVVLCGIDSEIKLELLVLLLDGCLRLFLHSPSIAVAISQRLDSTASLVRLPIGGWFRLKGLNFCLFSPGGEDGGDHWRMGDDGDCFRTGVYLL
jgi:hypothetical protein